MPVELLVGHADILRLQPVAGKLPRHQFLREGDDAKQLLGAVGVVEIDTQLLTVGQSADPADDGFADFRPDDRFDKVEIDRARVAKLGDDAIFSGD